MCWFSGGFSCFLDLLVLSFGIGDLRLQLFGWWLLFYFVVLWLRVVWVAFAGFWLGCLGIVEFG